MTGTYKSPQKKYYWKNKEKITERTREYKKEYNKAYYEKNKAVLNKKRVETKKKQTVVKRTQRNQRLRKSMYKRISRLSEEA